MVVGGKQELKGYCTSNAVPAIISMMVKANVEVRNHPVLGLFRGGCAILLLTVGLDNHTTGH